MYPRPTSCEAVDEPGDDGKVLEKIGRVVDEHVQHVGDRAVAIADFQRLPVESFAFAHRAGHVQIGQEIHFDLSLSLALAFLAPPAFDVETESARLVSALPGVAGVGEHLADFVEHAGICGRIAPRSAADGRLVDLHHLVDLIRAAEAFMRAGLGGQSAQAADQRPGQRFVQQRTFARSAHAGHAHQCRKRKLHGDVLEIVGCHAFQRDGAGFGNPPALLGHGNPLATGKITAGERIGIRGHCLRSALGHDFSALPARAGSHVDKPMGLTHDGLVVLDDQHRVAPPLQIAQANRSAAGCRGDAARSKVRRARSTRPPVRNPNRRPGARAATRRRLTCRPGGRASDTPARLYPKNRAWTGSRPSGAGRWAAGLRRIADCGRTPPAADTVMRGHLVNSLVGNEHGPGFGRAGVRRRTGRRPFRPERFPTAAALFRLSW